MTIFEFWSAADFNAGLFFNSRINNIYNTSPYGKDQVIPSIDPTVQNVHNGTDALPSPVRTWISNNPINHSISTYTASEYTVISGKAGAIDLIYATSPSGAFVKHYVDGVNIENVSLYGPLGSTVTYRVPLNNQQIQTVELQHTGYIDKSSPTLWGPFNIVGSSMASSIQLSPNGTSIITDIWTFTGIDANTFSIKRTGTGVTTTYSYNTLELNAIPGYDVTVNSATGGDVAVLKTLAPIVTLLEYIFYPDSVNFAQWQTPILDSNNSGTSWEFATAEILDQTTSMYSIGTYVSSVSVGNSLPKDSTWVTIQPTETAYNNIAATNIEQPYSKIFNSLGALEGRYAQVTFNISLYNGFIRDPRIYCWNPALDRNLSIVGPVATGPKLQEFIAGLTSSFQDKLTDAVQFANGLVVNTAEHAYLFKWGQILGFPIRRGESLQNYQARLTQLMQSAYSGSTLAFIQQAIRNYCGSSYPYILQPTPITQQWILGQSLLGIDTYLGARAAKYWTYEVHVKGSMPGIYYDGLMAFIYQINPIGAVPILILE